MQFLNMCIIVVDVLIIQRSYEQLKNKDNCVKQLSVSEFITLSLLRFNILNKINNVIISYYY